jgi:hypothetical protein
MGDLIIKGFAIGFGATVVMDLWAVLLTLALGHPRANWGPVGRWFWHLGRGTVFHQDIGLAEAHPREGAIGWIFHYAVGILYGIVFALFMGEEWFAAPTFLPAFVWGILTVTAGWFLLQPGLGLGWAASKLPNANQVRLLNLAAHTAFAVGLWATALLLR